MSFCSCGNSVHPKRVEILKSKKQSITCISCAENKVQRVVGFQVNEGKTERSIQVCSQAEYQRLNSLDRKNV